MNIGPLYWLSLYPDKRRYSTAGMCNEINALLNWKNQTSKQTKKQKNNTLSKAQRTQGTEYFASFNTLKSWPNFSLVLFGKGQEIHTITLTNPFNKFNKAMWELKHLRVKTVLGPIEISFRTVMLGAEIYCFFCPFMIR